MSEDLVMSGDAVVSGEHVCKAHYVSGTLMLPVNSAIYTCGDCNHTFTTICQLHEHIQNHDIGGSYHYDEQIKTAVPKYDSACMETQTCWKDRREGRRLFRNYLWRKYYYTTKKRGPKTRKRPGEAKADIEDGKAKIKFTKKGLNKYIPNATDISLLKKAVNDESFGNLQHTCLDAKVGKHLELSKAYRHEVLGNGSCDALKTESSQVTTKKKIVEDESDSSDMESEEEEIGGNERNLRSRTNTTRKQYVDVGDSSDANSEGDEVADADTNNEDEIADADINSEEDDLSSNCNNRNMRSKKNVTNTKLVHVEDSSDKNNEDDEIADADTNSKVSNNGNNRKLRSKKNVTNTELVDVEDSSDANNDENEISDDENVNEDVSSNISTDIDVLCQVKDEVGNSYNIGMAKNSDEILPSVNHEDNSEIPTSGPFIYTYDKTNADKQDNLDSVNATVVESDPINTRTSRRGRFRKKGELLPGGEPTDDLPPTQKKRGRPKGYVPGPKKKCLDLDPDWSPEEKLPKVTPGVTIPICDVKMEKSSELTMCDNVKTEGTFHCEKCNEDILVVERDAHKAEHARKKRGKYRVKKKTERIVCEVCGNSFPVGQIEKHRRMKHTGERPYGCDVCGKRFHTTAQVKAHGRVHIEGKLKCDHCEERFHMPSQLRNHLLLHTGEQECICPQCGIGLRRYSLKLHIDTVHLNIREHQCDVCHKLFGRKSNLIAHKRGMHDKVVFTCTFCGRTFSDSSSRRRHEMTHTGETLHQCQICEYKCIQSTPFFAHMSKEHGYSRDQTKEMIREKKLRENKYLLHKDSTDTSIL